MNAEEVVRAMVEGEPLLEETLYNLCVRKYFPEIIEVRHDEGLLRDGKQRIFVIFKIENERYFRIYYEKTRDWDRNIYTYPEQVAVEVEPRMRPTEIYYMTKENI